MKSEINYSIEKVHISSVVIGDTVLHEGVLATVGKGDIKTSEFMGRSLFGDSYRLGTKYVDKAIIHKAN